jgi:hypothetical protein
MFVLISLFELSRGLWIYHTLAYAAREGTRYASFHGRGCNSPNTCSVTIGQITQVIKAAGLGLDRDAVTVTFTAADGSESGDTMTNQLSNTTAWPVASANGPGQIVKISLKYPFRTFLGALWSRGNTSQVLYLPASSTEAIQF